jgi:peptide-methionine (S)-S-oxide reductase
MRFLRYVTTLLLPLMASPASSAPPAGAARSANHRTETATFAGGCFWSMNAIFERLQGVERVTAGFSGGTVSSPSYERVCTGTTGHAESVQITFDPAVISYRDLLNVFFAFHDPTTLNRQGADEGPQYRSAVFWHTPEQRDQVTKTIAELTARHTFNAPIVTQVLSYKEFFPAEAYHQGYYDRHSVLPYCQLVIAPKVAKLRKLYRDRLKPSM